MNPSRVLVFVLVAALPGCVGPASPDGGAGLTDSPADAWARVQQAMSGVPCVPDDDTARTTTNLRELARLAPDDVYSPGFHAELTVREDARGTFAIHARALDGGFDILDIAHPLEPRWVTAWDPQADGRDADDSGTPATALDVKLSSDGTTAIVGGVGELVLVDVRDLTAPIEIGRWQFPRPHPGAQGHMLSVHAIDADGAAGPAPSQDYVFVATQSDWGVWIFRLAGPPHARWLEPLTAFAQGLNGPIGPHDQAVVEDPLLDVPVLFVANGLHGWLAADVTDPAQPRVLGGLLPADPSNYAHSIAVAYVGDKRLVITSSEAGATSLKVYDATNLLLPVPVAQWKDDYTNPLAVQHNIITLDNRLYLAHWERGLFVFDLATLPTALPLAGTAAMKPVAHFSVGDRPNSNFIPFFTNGYGNLNGVLDVVVHRGILNLATIHDGLITVGDGCLEPGDPLDTSMT